MTYRWNRFTFHDNRDLQRAGARIGRRRTRRSLRRLLPRLSFGQGGAWR